jgi:hypothetical protein
MLAQLKRIQKPCKQFKKQRKYDESAVDSIHM